MSQQIQLTGGAKVRSLEGVITGTSGVLSSVPLGGANGVATLDSGGKVPVSQLPASVVTYLGTWNAATNTPTLTNGVGDPGDLYICNVAGTVNFGAGPITFAVGDWVIYGSGTWQKSSGQNGTVTSVAMTTPSGLNVSGSPITTSGTLALSLASGYTIPLSTQLVPTGGTAGQILAKNSNTAYDTTWIENYANWTEQVRDTVKASVVINKGQAVYISGANGTNQLVSLADNTTEATSSKTLGLAMQNFAINDIGQIITEGLLGGLDTHTATAGDPVWLGTSGNLIFGLANKPAAPAHLVYIGVVTRVNLNNGEIYVKIQNGFELQELHNVSITSPANGNILQYDSATSLWKNVAGTTTNIAEGTNLYYTDARARGSLSFVAGSGAYNSTTGVITIPTNNNQITNGAGYITLGSLSASSPLSYNSGTGAFSISQATTSTNGYLSSTDWNTFNSKQSALTFSSPLVNTSGTISIPAATSLVNGYLSSSDWSTFNSKQSAITLTTTGTSGAATFVGNTLNIPQYQAAGTYVTSVTGTSPISSSGGTTPAISISQSNATTNGYLSSTDWSTFNSKQAAITLTTTGSSGSATFVSNTLNVPTYTLSGLGGQPLAANLTSLAGLSYLSASFVKMTAAGTFSLDTNTYYLASNPSGYTSNLGTVTLVAALTLGTSGTDLSSSVATGTTTPVITLNVPTASATNRGALSSADWTTFNNKQNALTNPVTGTGTTNYLSKFTGTSTIGNSIIQDNGTYVSVGYTTNPALYTLDVNGTGRFTGALTGTSATFTGNILISGASVPFTIRRSAISGQEATIRYNTNGSDFFFAGLADGTNNYRLYNVTTGNNDLVIAASTGAATFSSSVTNNGLLKSTNTYVSDTTIYQQFNDTTGTALNFGGTASGYKWIQAQDSSGASTYYNLLLNPRGGNVGIGTASPNNTTSGRTVLDINGTSTSWINQSVGGTSISYLGANSTNGFWVTDGAYYLVLGTNNTERMRITSGGNVLIGTTTDSGQGKLQVSGGITGGGISLSGSAYSATASLTKAYYHVINGLTSSGQTFTLPSVSGNNFNYVIINLSPYTQTIAAASTETIVDLTGSGVTSISLATNKRCWIIADGGSKSYQIF